jgi:hypothetical protein
MNDSRLKQIILGAIIEYSNSWNIEKAIEYGLELAKQGTIDLPDRNITEREKEIYRQTEERISRGNLDSNEIYFSPEERIGED